MQTILAHGTILPALLVLFAAGCGEGPPTAATPNVAADPGLPSAPPLETAQLTLNLSVGDRIPVRKVVEQDVVQTLQVPGRKPDTSRSRLDMLLTLTVEDVGPGGTRCALRYDRIRLSRNVAGRQLDYDSAQPPVALPLEVAAYQGMIGRGFLFWIGPDHRIARVAGFAEFVQAALAGVPPESRDEVLLGAEMSAGKDGVADLLDDTIGLLPLGAPRAAGDTWRQTRRSARPVPMHIDTLCTLRELTDELAVIDLRGDVTPLVSTGVQAAAHESARLVVERGTTVGECTFFRDTGLPQRAQIVQEVDLSFTMLSKLPVRQHQRMTTTIESFPAVRAAARPGSPR